MSSSCIHTTKPLVARAVLHSKCVTLTVKYYILLTDGLCGNIANNITTKTTLIRAKKYKIRYSNTPIGFNFNRAVLQCFVFFSSVHLSSLLQEQFVVDWQALATFWLLFYSTAFILQILI